MIELEGKYNTAHIMIDTVDETTIAQIMVFLNQPTFADSHIAIMPDCHAGAGSCIGFTMPINKYVIPNVIGVDIGCGMLSYNFGKTEVDLPALDRFIKQSIPAGFNVHRKEQIVPQMMELDIKVACEEIGLDPTRAFQSIGTLGGGNHFIEVGRCTSDNLWVTVHSGSRNFGLKIAQHYQGLALKNVVSGDKTPKGLEHLVVGSVDANKYMRDLRTAQRYASINRERMLSKITDYLGKGSLGSIESVHNFIGDDNVIRKGATPARKGEMVLIPFNMRDGIAVCTGKGNAMYNCSAPHGAGRVLSRSKAKEQLDLGEFQKQMKDAKVYTTTANASTLDEAPGAYKDMDLILDNIGDTVDVEFLIKPIYNFKA